MEIINLTNKQIPLIKSKDIMLFMFAEGGAMGIGGKIQIFTKEESVIKCYEGNYTYGDIDMKKIEKVIPAFRLYLDSKELIDWKYEYLGMGNHLLIKDCIYGAFKESARGAVEDDLYGIYMQVAEEVLEAYCNNSCGKLYNLQWSRNELTPQKLGTFCEYYAKMALASYGLSIYSSEVDDHGIDFVVETEKRFLKFQVKSARLATTGYVLAHKDKFIISDDSLFMFLILLTDGEHPQSYIIPTSAWREDNGTKLFVDRDNYTKPEWGINISKKNMLQLDKYSIDKMITNLK